MVFNCGPMDSGTWTIRFWQTRHAKPLVYEMSATFLPPKSRVDAFSRNTDLLMTDWQVDDVILVYNGPDRSLQSTVSTTVAASTTITSSTTVITSTTSKLTFTCSTSYSTFYDWSVCGGGLVTIVLILQFTYFCLVQPFVCSARPNRILRRWTRGTLALLISVSFIQLFVRLHYCN